MIGTSEVSVYVDLCTGPDAHVSDQVNHGPTMSPCTLSAWNRPRSDESPGRWECTADCLQNLGISIADSLELKTRGVAMFESGDVMLCRHAAAQQIAPDKFTVRAVTQPHYRVGPHAAI
jgi:hypothetical protein